MNRPYVVFQRPFGHKRTVVVPTTHEDGIADPLAVCRHLAAVAASNNVDATPAVIDETGAARLLGDAA